MGRRRPHKLDPSAYVGRSAAVTMSLVGRQAVLNRPDVVAGLVEKLREASAKHECVVPIYCFMSDHLHLIVKAVSDTASPVVAIQKFRLQSGIWLYNHGYKKWESGDWDEVIGSQEEWRRQLLYIALNPVRAGLVENWPDYPFTGSLTGEVKDILL